MTGAEDAAALMAAVDPNTAATVRDAVAAALNPAVAAATKSQAGAYLDALRESKDGWKVCLALYLAEDPNLNPQLVFFCIQVLEAQLRCGLPDADAATLRRAFWAHLVDAVTPGTAAAQRPPVPPYLRNKVAQLVTKLFAAQWPAQWPAFWDDLFALLPADLRAAAAAASGAGAAAAAALAPPAKAAAARAVDMFLRICYTIDQEIVNLLIHREQTDVAHNQLLKDMMREGPVQEMVRMWFAIAVAYANHEDSVVACLKNVALYVSWIDVNLVVNDSWIPLLFQHLESSCHGIRLAALDCLNEIVGKGMKPEDKLELIRALRIFDVLQTVSAQLLPNTPNLEEEDDDLIFVEHLGKLVNTLGCVLVAIWMETIEPAPRAAIESLIAAIFPLFIQYFANDWDHVSTTVHEYGSEWLSLVKRAKRARGGTDAALSPAERDMVRSLLTVVLRKMQYDADQTPPITAHETGTGLAAEEEDDEDVAHFQEMRRQLKILYDNIATIDHAAWIEQSVALMGSVFDQYQANPATVRWCDAELALYVLYLFGEGSRLASTVVRDRNLIAYRETRPNDPNPGPWTPMGQIMIRVMQSGIGAYPHPCIAPLFLENVHRYAEFYLDAPEFIPRALDAFVAALHAPHPGTRARASYLLLRTAKAVKAHLAPLVDTLLGSMSDLLVVPVPDLNAPPPAPKVADGSVAAAAEATAAGNLDMFLYETVSLLISLEQLPVDKRTEYLGVALAPLMQALQRDTAHAQQLAASPASAKQQNQLNILASHAANVVQAAGSLAKEFPGRHVLRDGTPPWVGVFGECNSVVLESLTVFAGHAEFREAARFAFQRSVGPMGDDAFPQLPALVQPLLTRCTLVEAADLLSFLGMLMYKYKAAIAGFIDELIRPTVAMVFAFLGRAPEGTDETMQQVNLKRQYLSFLGSTVTSGPELDLVLLSPTNFGGVLPDILSSVASVAMDASDRALQKVALSLIGKFAMAWTVNRATTTPLPAHVPASWPGDALRPIAARACVEMPLQACSPTDAGSLVILHEVASLHMHMLRSFGVEGWPQYLAAAYLPAVQCPPELANEYATAVATLDPKKLQAYLREFVKRFRS
ncbi:pre-tRNA nuclear export protein [Blastocladiella emersonii ATCC 22665]|nr:pre-tRNA nuclear export protein [Blastocladiella emersonii ATCC 22665]